MNRICLNCSNCFTKYSICFIKYLNSIYIRFCKFNSKIIIMSFFFLGRIVENLPENITKSL